MKSMKIKCAKQSHSFFAQKKDFAWWEMKRIAVPKHFRFSSSWPYVVFSNPTRKYEFLHNFRLFSTLLYCSAMPIFFLLVLSRSGCALFFLLQLLCLRIHTHEHFSSITQPCKSDSHVLIALNCRHISSQYHLVDVSWQPKPKPSSCFFFLNFSSLSPGIHIQQKLEGKKTALLNCTKKKLPTRGTKETAKKTTQKWKERTVELEIETNETKIRALIWIWWGFFSLSLVNMPPFYSPSIFSLELLNILYYFRRNFVFSGSLLLFIFTHINIDHNENNYRRIFRTQNAHASYTH